MLLAIDAGNTNIVFALFDEGMILHAWRCETNAEWSVQDYTAWLYEVYTTKKLPFDAVKNAIISSVVPQIDSTLKQLCREMFGCDALMVDAGNAGIKTNLPNPAQAGADRLVNAVAAIHDYGTPAIVIDFGTATTFDVINARGEYCGGVIAPGPGLSMKALHMAAAKLPLVGIEKPPLVIGDTTIHAMQSGIYWGYVGLIEGTLKRVMKEMGRRKPYVIATGGLASLFADDIPAIKAQDEHLTLRGLLYIHQMHSKAQKAA